MNFDIIIIGGSFAGMTSALALAVVSDDLKIAIVERQDILNHDRKRDGRAYAISSASLKLFEEIGIFERLEKEAGKISDIKITDQKSPFILDFIGSEVEGDFGMIIENYHIHNALRDEVLKRKNVTVFCPNFYEEIKFLHERDDAVTEPVLQQRHEREDGVANPVQQRMENEREDTVRDPVVQQDPECETLSRNGSLTQSSRSRQIKLDDGRILAQAGFAIPPGGSCQIKLDNKTTLSSKLILACDGRFSKLRETYQIPTTVKNYHQTAIVFNISHEKSHQNIAHEKFLPGGPLAILPFKDHNQSSIVWIFPSEEAKAILKLDEENFTHQLSKKMENVLGEIKIISEKFSYPLIAIEAKDFYYKKMLLIGDAACGVHPIAGQGFNLAISGIKILQELIRENLFCGFDISAQSVIDSYNKKAKIGARKMLIATDVLNSIFETKSFSLKTMRDVGLGLVNKIGPLKRFFIKSAGGF